MIKILIKCIRSKPPLVFLSRDEQSFSLTVFGEYVVIDQYMPVFQTTQVVKSDIGKCWSFFSDPANLANITPPSMKFIIKYPNPVPEMYQGMIIKYKVTPLFKLPMEWITEITEVSKPNYFVDNQVKGPYQVWHHQHFFEEIEEGVKITDIVTYKLPLGFIGSLFAGWIVKRKIESIFEYRRNAILRAFL